MKSAHVLISGTVQGVGYRYFVRSNARRLGLSGYVRNTEDGGVEAVFSGDEKVIEKIITLCREGPLFAEVKDIAVEWIEDREKFKDFSIKLG